MTFTKKNVIGLIPRPASATRLTGNAAPASAVVYDLIGRQQAEKHQQWLAMIVESSSEAIIGKSLAGDILSWNEAAERLFGYSAVMVLGHPLTLLFASAEAEEVRALLQRCARGEHIDSYETECIRADGQRIGISLTLSPLKDKTGAIVGMATIARDITQRKRTEDRLHQLAFHDSLTGLPNRFLLRERIGQALVQARRHDRRVALLFIDLNRFKEINDTLGHPIGDRLLRIAARRLRYSVREGDTVARLGGDEFVVCLSALTERNDAILIAAKIDAALREPLRIGSHELNISGSIGISVYPEDGQNLETLLQAADTAMYQAKKQPEGGVHSPSPIVDPALMSSPNTLQGPPGIN